MADRLRGVRDKYLCLESFSVENLSWTTTVGGPHVE
jgi:hypothetical protein